MEYLRRLIVDRIVEGHLPDDYHDVFGELYSEETGTFPIQESTHWDYKDSFPPNFSDDYFGGIVRLVCAFYNTFGGIVIFGVHDTERTCGHNSVKIDIERFNAVLRERLNVPIECVHRRYALPLPTGGTSGVDVLLVPKRPLGVPPARLISAIGRYKTHILWARYSHQVLEVAPEDISFLYSDRGGYGLDLEEPALPVHKSFPPPAAIIKKFIGRIGLMDQLWQWLITPDEPRLFLHGPGGSGKSTLAYEFAKSVSRSASSAISQTGGKLDFVVYLSAKETELDSEQGRIRSFSGQDFTTPDEQFRLILIHAGWKTPTELEGLSKQALLKDLNTLFDEFFGLVVIDDIDTLTRRGVDAGIDDLFKVLIRCKSGSKVLYTLRNKPQMSMASAIKVPGMDFEAEFPDFIAACSKHFNVEHPNGNVVIEIKEASECLPLVTETIIGLRRRTPNYREAIRLYNENSGSDARDYLFRREYEGLGIDNRARHLLAALSLFSEPVSFESLIAILRFSEEQLSDAIGEVTEIFLNVDSTSGPETLYTLLPVAKKFVFNISKKLDRFSEITARSKPFIENRVLSRPEIAQMRLKVDPLLAKGAAREALALIENSGLPPEVTENPVFQALAGSVFAAQTPPRYESARTAFEFAVKAGLKDLSPVRSWFYMEFRSGFALDNALRVCDLVVAGQQYGVMAKSEFLGKKAQVYKQKARNLLLSVYEADSCLENFRLAVMTYLSTAAFAASHGIDGSKAGEWAEQAFAEMVNAALKLRRPEFPLDVIRDAHSGKASTSYLMGQIVRFINIIPNIRDLSLLSKMKGSLHRIKGVSSSWPKDARDLFDASFRDALIRIEGGGR